MSARPPSSMDRTLPLLRSRSRFESGGGRLLLTFSVIMIDWDLVRAQQALPAEMYCGEGPGRGGVDNRLQSMTGPFSLPNFPISLFFFLLTFPHRPCYSEPTYSERRWDECRQSALGTQSRVARTTTIRSATKAITLNPRIAGREPGKPLCKSCKDLNDTGK